MVYKGIRPKRGASMKFESVNQEKGAHLYASIARRKKIPVSTVHPGLVLGSAAVDIAVDMSMKFHVMLTLSEEDTVATAVARLLR